MTIKKLARMPYAQAHVEIDEAGNIHLFSYTTLVVAIDKDGWLSCTGLYSRTTRKHIGAFMREYGGLCDYYAAKDAYEGGYCLNINTGEIEELGE